MRFTCEHCGKRYVTNDVLLPGRIYRTKCKACGGVITVKGTAETASPTGEVPAAGGAPARTTAPSLASLTAVTPTPPATPAATPRPTPPPAPAISSPPPPLQAVVAPPPPPAAPRAEPKYIDLFEGEGLDAPPSTPPPAPARRKGMLSPSLVEPTPPRGTPLPAPPPAPDPFAVAAKVTSPAEPPRPPPPAPRPAAATRAPEPRREAPAVARPARRRGPLLVGLGASLAAIALLAVAAVWRPWESSRPGGAKVATALPTTVPTPAALTPPQPAAEPAAAPATATAAAPPPAAQPAAAQPAPEPAKAAAPPADDRQARLEKEQEKAEQARLEKERIKAEKLEKDRQAREEKDRLKADKLEQARLEKERIKAEKLEKERQAREEKERVKAEKLEAARLAKEEKAERDRKAVEQAKLAKADAAVPTSPARLEVAPPPPQQPPPPPPPAPGLSPQAIEKALTSGRKAFEACFRDQARGIAPPIDATQATVHFLVQPAGTVVSPEVSDEKVAASPAAQCLKTAAVGLQFPAFKGEPAKVDAPIAIPPGPAGGRLIAVEFAGTKSSRYGGEVDETVYSERPNDAKISDKSFADGVLTYTGQVGMGEGSKFAGIGINVNILPGGKPVDASRFKSLTIKLAATGTKSLRIRLIGADDTTRLNGCYPVTGQRVSPEVKEYTIKFSEFDPENWCGSKGRSPSKTIKELSGFEIADANMDRQPVTISAGSIVLNP